MIECISSFKMINISFYLIVQDDETTMSEEEELAKVDSNDPMDEVRS